MNESHDWIQYVYNDQNHIYSILNILYEFSEPSYFDIRNFSINHVRHFDQTSYHCCIYQNRWNREDLNKERNNEKADEEQQQFVEIGRCPLEELIINDCS